jgi:hypothetical protein
MDLFIYSVFYSTLFENMLTLRKRRQPELDHPPKADPAGYRHIIETISVMPDTMRNMVFNYMVPSDIYANLLMDNPKVNLTKIFLEYLHYLREHIDDVRESNAGPNIIKIFGLDPANNWTSLNCREHLINISADQGIFMEYISWDCPFVITLMTSIQNNDGETLQKYIEFYHCIEAECSMYIFEFLVKYAFDFRRILIIGDIINAYKPLFCGNNMSGKLNDTMAVLMDYFVDNYGYYNSNNMVNEQVDFVKLIELLENNVPDLYKYYQVNWTGYAYYLVKHNNISKLMELANHLEEPYMALDYEIIVYALIKQKEGCLCVLLSGFKWNDRRDDMDKARFNDLTKTDLEKMLWYVLQNIENQDINPEKGFDPSFVGYPLKINKPNQSGIRNIYRVGEKRFHMSIYLKSMLSRQMVMLKWCNDVNENPNAHGQNFANDIQERLHFNDSIRKFMVRKLNKAIKGINRYHTEHNNLSELVEQYTEIADVMFYQCQYYDPDIAVI